MKSLILLLSIGCVLSSCTTTTSGYKQAPIFEASPLDTVYHAIRPEIQHFNIKNDVINQIKAANGTEILIPANCFVDLNGMPVTDVQLDVVEALSLPAFVTAGLITMSDSTLLMSNGMMYFNATANNQPLMLIDGHNLTVSMPTMGGYPNDFQLFTGNGKDWQVDSAMTALDYAIPLPLEILYPRRNKSFVHCDTYMTDMPHQSYYYDTTIINVTDSKYENTKIATEEFTQRIDYLLRMMNWMSTLLNKDDYMYDIRCEQMRFNYEIWKAYYEFPQRSFREADSIAKQLYIGYFKKNKEKLAALPEFNGMSVDKLYMQLLDHFNESTAIEKELKLINDYGVNLDAPDAQNQLIAKNVALPEINDIMAYHFRRRQMIKQLKSLIAMSDNSTKMDQLYSNTVFAVTKMGWINCDRFYDAPGAGKAVITVADNSGKDLDFIDYSLVIPAFNARLSAFPDGAGGWTFTKKEGPYTKLPLGIDAVITGVSLQHDSVFFASRKITIKDSLEVQVTMRPIHSKDLKDSLVNALK